MRCRLECTSRTIFSESTPLSNVQTRSLCTHRTRPALVWARSRDHAKSSVIVVFPPPRGDIASMHAGGRANTRGMDRDGHRGFERSMRPRVAHGVRMSGAPRRSRSQQPVLDATPPPAPLHRAEALELGNLNRLTYLVVSPGWQALLAPISKDYGLRGSGTASDEHTSERG